MLRTKKAKIRIHIVECGSRTGTTLMAIACFEIDAYTEHEDSIYTRPSRQGNIFLIKRPRDILVAEQLELHGQQAIAKDLIEYGYESDDSWLNQLEGITPDYSDRKSLT